MSTPDNPTVSEASEERLLEAPPAEAPITQQELEQIATRPPEEVAYEVFHKTRPQFNHFVSKLGANALRRLVNKLIEYPLNEKPYNAATKEEKAAFYLGFRLLEAKFAAYFTEMGKEANQIAQQQEQETKPEGENNGET